MAAPDLVTIARVYLAILRYVAPAMAFLLLLRCAWPLLTFPRQPEIWGWLIRTDGQRLPISHWENLIGRSRRCDVIIPLPSVSRCHCVLCRYDDGSWSVTDANSHNGLRVNGEDVWHQELLEGDLLDIGEERLRFLPATGTQEQTLASLRPRAANMSGSFANLLLLTAFQAMCCGGYLLSGTLRPQDVLIGWGGIMLLQWCLLIFNFLIRRPSFEVETLAFLLCSMGMAVISTVAPQESIKQLVAIALGIGLFLLLGWSLRDLERAKIIRYIAAILGMALLIITLLFGETYYGAKNWLNIFGFSVQPSELTKLCFVYVGASTMDRLIQRRNIVLFIAYTVALCGFLALMNDFGTALVFFTAFLIIAYLRSGSLGTIALACTALVFAAVIGLQIAPHALRRLNIWRNIWSDPLGAGYQQTRSLMCVASGGVFGLGLGRGKMKYLFASDSDVVFATVSEEWGIAMMVILILTIVVLAIFSIRCALVSRSTFYAIAACTASGILLVQTIFNVLGTVDVLPLTGVTFPFLSNGGSSMLCVWGLLAFMKAADTRPFGSFAVRLKRKERHRE